MKLLIIICVAVLLLQAGTLALGISIGDGDAPSDEEIEDGSWNPKEQVPKMAWVANLLDSFQPQLDLGWEQKGFAAGRTEPVKFEHDEDDRLVAKFKLINGTGVMIQYDCAFHGRKGYECPQTACVCPVSAVTDEPRAVECQELELNGIMCPTKGEMGVIVVYTKTGTLRFSGLGSGGGTVEQR